MTPPSDQDVQRGFIFKSQTAKFIVRLGQAEQKLLHKIGNQVAGQAQMLAPIDTGNLAGSIDYKADEAHLSVTIGTPVEYGPFVELGTGRRGQASAALDANVANPFPPGYVHGPTKGHVAQPYLFPALLYSEKAIVRYVREEYGAVEGSVGISLRLADDSGKPGDDQ